MPYLAILPSHTRTEPDSLIGKRVVTAPRVGGYRTSLVKSFDAATERYTLEDTSYLARYVEHVDLARHPASLAPASAASASPTRALDRWTPFS